VPPPWPTIEKATDTASIAAAPIMMAAVVIGLYIEEECIGFPYLVLVSGARNAVRLVIDQAHIPLEDVLAALDTFDLVE
jgi:hypothetical protein